MALGLSLALFGASIVILHAHWLSFAESITFPAAALLGVAIVAFVRKTDVSGALPGIAVLLPSMLLVVYDQMAGLHAIPWYAFLLAALPPLSIGLLAIPPMSRLDGHRSMARVLVALPRSDDRRSRFSRESRDVAGSVRQMGGQIDHHESLMQIEVAKTSVVEVYQMLVGIVTPRPIAWVTPSRRRGW